MIIANMATFPARVEICKQVVDSIYNQVDQINLCFNEFKQIPKEYAKYHKLNPVIPDTDYKDVGKFVHKVSDNDEVILIDDDIIYPCDYIKVLRYFYKKYQHLNIIVGTHGIIYPDLYDGSVSSRKVFTFKHSLKRPRVVNQLGTGTVYLKGSQMPSLEYMKGSQSFVDVRFSKYMFEKGIGLICIPRGADWQKEIKQEDSIFNNFTSKWPMQVIQEVQIIAGYSKLPFNLVKEIEFNKDSLLMSQ